MYNVIFQGDTGSEPLPSPLFFFFFFLIYEGIRIIGARGKDGRRARQVSSNAVSQSDEPNQTRGVCCSERAGQTDTERETEAYVGEYFTSASTAN